MDDDLENARKKKMEEMQRKVQDDTGYRQEQEQQQVKEQKKSIIRQILDPDARTRLNTIKMAKPEFADKIENLLVQLAQSGQIKQRITDAQFKEILSKVSSKKKDIKIKRI